MNVIMANNHGIPSAARGNTNQEKDDMAFVNEYIPEADYVKYDLRRVCGEHNLGSRRGHMHSNHWTINRARDTFLIKVWSHHEAEFEGYAFYWKAEWLFFEMRLNGVDMKRPDGSCWVGYLIKGFSLPYGLVPKRSEIMSDLTQALSDYCGAGVFTVCTSCTATINFIEEK